ncbi:VC0807 family protein [Amycolatopsis sp. cmx-4-54]|uniref:VC0807 family protein n=1 Tax=Amycolatopsis sp. cmx-4-54 TaxID=2790936 RepID=UPI00397CBAAB
MSLIVLVVTFLRTRELTFLGSLVLVRFALGIAVAVVTGDPRLELVKDLVITGVIGVMLAISLGWRRPIIARIRRDISENPDVFDRTWSYGKAFRIMHRRLTALWAIILVVEAGTGILAAYTIPLTAAVVLTTIVSPVATLGLIGVTQYWGLRANTATAAPMWTKDSRCAAAANQMCDLRETSPRL